MFRKTMFSRPSVMRAPINWNRLIFRYTDSKTREHLAQLQGKFAEITGLYASVPKKVDDINWDEYRKTITTPGIVDQFKSEYDEQMKKEVKANAAELAAKKSSQEGEIRALEAKAATSAEFLSELKSEIAWTEQWEQNPEQVTQGTQNSWNQFKQDHYYPAYKIHRVNRVLFLGDPMRNVGREVNKIDNIDLIELRKQLENGNVRAMGAVVPLISEVGDVTALQRPFIKKWIKPTNYDDTFKNPNNSLPYRAFALKQILESGN
jgi:hypothetical protein